MLGASRGLNSVCFRFTNLSNMPIVVLDVRATPGVEETEIGWKPKPNGCPDKIVSLFQRALSADSPALVATRPVKCR